MASDDTLAQGQSRKRWFGGSRACTRRGSSNDRVGSPGIVGTGARRDSCRADRPAQPVPEEVPNPSSRCRSSETLASLRARGGETEEEVVLPLVISIANQKGGVGKTTTAVNLGAALAELEYRVLVIDLDPQGNATTGMGISHRNVEGSIYDVIMNDAPIDDCTEPTTVKNLFVVPANIDLAGAEIELVPAFSRELKLRRALAAIAGSYDFTLIDCPRRWAC